jgi:hypothetical protein
MPLLKPKEKVSISRFVFIEDNKTHTKGTTEIATARITKRLTGISNKDVFFFITVLPPCVYTGSFIR